MGWWWYVLILVAVLWLASVVWFVVAVSRAPMGRETDWFYREDGDG